MNNSQQRGAVVDLSEQGSIDDQAARWVARLDFEEPNPTIVADFKRWINQSPAHWQAFESYVDLWGEMDLMAELVPPSRQQRRVWQWLPRPMAVSWVALAGIMIVTLLTLPLFNSPDAEVYVTAIGEQRQLQLSDGSSALLNTNTRMAVRYTAERREIHLLQGEAHFEVKHNADKPFEVSAGNGLVRAVGTAFTVHLRNDDVEVVVTEGVIEIDSVPPPDQAAAQATTPAHNQPATVVNPGQHTAPAVTPTPAQPRVSAGAFATYDRHTAKHIVLAELEKIEQKTAWQQGLLIFDDEPLEQVVAEVGRYTSTRIVIQGSRLRQFKVGGQFKVGDTEAMFEALQISFNIRAKMIADDLIYLVLDPKQK